MHDTLRVNFEWTSNEPCKPFDTHFQLLLQLISQLDLLDQIIQIAAASVCLIAICSFQYYRILQYASFRVLKRPTSAHHRRRPSPHQLKGDWRPNEIFQHFLQVSISTKRFRTIFSSHTSTRVLKYLRVKLRLKTRLKVREAPLKPNKITYFKTIFSTSLCFKFSQFSVDWLVAVNSLFHFKILNLKRKLFLIILAERGFEGVSWRRSLWG